MAMTDPTRPELQAHAGESGEKASFNALTHLGNRFSRTGRSLFYRLLPFAARKASAQPQSRVDTFRELAEALLSVRGEASGVAIATDLLELYRSSKPDDRLAFFTMLADRFGPDEQVLASRYERFRAEGASALPALFEAVEAPRQELVRRLNLAPGGTEALVRMRADLLVFRDADPALEGVDADMRHLFQSWFNRGFLAMRSIDWSSPASLLERLIRYEAVHDIANWDDLRRRLDPEDRRCYAFFHPAMPEEPLIFVEVGLTRGLPDNIQAVLDPTRATMPAALADTATFYSISNCQPGLRGISFGHFLIKQVAEDLKRELPGLNYFVTLSPVPGLMRWLRSVPLAPADEATIKALETAEGLAGLDDAEARACLLRLAVSYFTQARNAHGRPFDPVARFHLGNGAVLERLNWRGDTSAKGMRQAGGLMVNYLYDLAHVEENHEAYAERGEIRTGTAFRKLRRTVAGV